MNQEAQARAAIETNPTWYHSIELAPGVVTPGFADLRPMAPKILPDALHGLRALDVGTFDGFWAFELEKRGASVVAIDVERADAAEWPPLKRERLSKDIDEWDVELGRGFRHAKEVLGSSAERIPCSVYDLTADAIGGDVDLVFIGALLLHLRDPTRALERVFDVLRPDGRLIMYEPFSVKESLFSPRRPLGLYSPLTSDFTWWRANVALIRAMPLAAGFVDVEKRGYHRPPAIKAMRERYHALWARKPS